MLAIQGSTVKDSIRIEDARILSQDLCRVPRNISDDAVPAQKLQIGPWCHISEMRLGKTEYKLQADAGFV
jgi:hypothetical protein